MFLHRASHWGLSINGTIKFDALLGMFQQKLIEFSITPLIILPERLIYMDYAVLTWTTTPTIVFRHPQASLRNIFFEPLSDCVWAMILVVIFCVSFLISLTTKLYSEKKITFVRAFMTTFAILCQQGFIENFSKVSSRMILLVSILFSLLVYQFYSSFIVSSLLTDSPKTIKNLRQLIDSDLKVGLENISYAIDFFVNTNDSMSKQLFKKKISKNSNYMSVDDGLKLLKKGGFAFCVDTSYAYLIMKDLLSDEENCELQEIKNEAMIPKRPLRNGLLKGSPFRELFVISLQRLKENGIMDYHTQSWSAKKPKCVQSNAKITSVDIKAASAMFILLAVSILASFGVLMIEIIHFRCVYRSCSLRTS